VLPLNCIIPLIYIIYNYFVYELGILLRVLGEEKKECC